MKLAGVAGKKAPGVDGEFRPRRAGPVLGFKAGVAHGYQVSRIAVEFGTS